MAQYQCLDCKQLVELTPSLLGPVCPKCGSKNLRLAGAMQWEPADDPDYDPEQPCET